MATTYKILGQQAPAGTSETTLYTVPSATQAIVSTIAIANLTTSVATATVNVKQNGAAASNANTLLKTVNISPLSTTTLTLGITMGAADLISVTSGTGAALSYQAFGSEIA